MLTLILLGFQAVWFTILEPAQAAKQPVLNFLARETQEESLPFVHFPYGTYQASSYDTVNDVCVSHNLNLQSSPANSMFRSMFGEISVTPLPRSVTCALPNHLPR